MEQAQQHPDTTRHPITPAMIPGVAMTGSYEVTEQIKKHF
jgi:hypothetical protein